MENRTFYYARVSSREQNLDRQIDAFKELGANERDVIVDKESGKNLERTGYTALKNNMLRSGDTLIVTSLDRLSRDKGDIKLEMEYFREHKIRLKILDIPTTLIDPPLGQEWVFEMVENILIEVLGSFAENERKQIKKRQAEGIASAKNKGVKFGRPAMAKPENWDEVFKKWKQGEITAVEGMRLTGVTKNIFYKFAKEKNEGK